MDMWYSRTGIVQGNASCIVTAKGTIERPNPSLTENDFIMGTTPWIEQNSIVYPVYKFNAPDEIWVYNIDTQTHTIAGPPTEEYNFDPDWPIIHSNIVDGIYYFTDGRWNDAMYNNAGDRIFNPPYQLNLVQALAGDYSTLYLQAIDAVKWPPLPPVAGYITDDTHSDNKLRNKLFQFTANYVYESNQPSAYSGVSNLALPNTSEFVSGNNAIQSNNDNAIEVTFFTGPEVVKKINIAVREFNGSSTSAPFGVFLQIDKELDNVPDNVFRTITYYGNTASKTLPFELANYDRLPINAYGQEFLPSKQLCYANFREGYDKIEIDCSVTGVAREVRWAPQMQVLQVPGAFGADIDFSWTSTSYFGLQAGDTYSIYIQTIDPSFANLYLTYTFTQGDLDDILQEATVADQLQLALETIGDAYAQQINDFFGPGTVTVSTIGSTIQITGPDFFIQAVSPISQERLTGVKVGMKTGATHPFGILYVDRAMRDGTVLTSDAMSLFVPFYPEQFTNNFDDPNDPYYVTGRLFVNHTPPIWARYYYIVAIKATEISDFQQTTINQIIPEGTRYKITLQQYYGINGLEQPQYIGANIQHQIQKGDIARIYRKKVDDDVPVPSDYVQDYFELEVQDYSPNEGLNGSQCIWVTNGWNLANIDDDPDENPYTGQQIEIYTPQPTLNTNGTLFVPQWKIISPAYEIIDAHTGDRRHAGTIIYGTVAEATSGSNSYILVGDYEFLLDYVGITMTFPVAGEVEMDVVSATYDSTTGFTTVTTTVNAPENATYFPFTTTDEADQGVGFGATLDLIYYGDIYLRQRDLGTGYPDGVPSHLFYWCEDPHYSDYWLSNVHNTGQNALESPFARMVHKRASAIHSNSFIDNSQINGLSTFELSNENVQDMDEQYGDIYRVILDGKTLKCLQPRKENSIYVQGSYAVTADGQFAQAGIINKTFAGWKPYESVHGCMDGGMVVLVPNQGIMYFDRKSGAFIESLTNGQMVVSENEYKFRKITKFIASLFDTYPDAVGKAYVDETNGEVGFGVSFYGERAFYLVTFDYVNRRWRSSYDYNFRAFANIGLSLVGFGKNNQLYTHNEDSFMFHGDSFVQKVYPVSNDQPTIVKRWNDIGVKSNKGWSVRAYVDPNQSYELQETRMGTSLFQLLEGHYWTRYRRNVFSQGYATDASEELKLVNGQEMRATYLIHEMTYDPAANDARSVLFSLRISGTYSETIQ